MTKLLLICKILSNACYLALNGDFLQNYKAPDFETRVSILKNKLYRDGVEMPDDIIEYVAKHIKTNVRELEGAIISLIAQSSFNKKEITVNLAKEIVEKLVKTHQT